MSVTYRTSIATLVLLLVGFVLQAPRAYAFFDQRQTSLPVSGIMIGEFTLSVPEWNPNTNYQVGDRFIFNGKLWEIRAIGDFTRPPEGDKLRPFGPYQEVTDEYRDYNTYLAGDIVIFNGMQYQALNSGMSGQTPGTVTGWQALVDEWQFFNVYFEGDTVLFNGNTYQANYWTQGDIPEGDNVGPWAPWRLIQAVISFGETEHAFDATILNATITLNGVVIVENGVINTSNAASIGITVRKLVGGAYWEFEGTGRLRIRENGQFQYLQGFTFNSLIVDLP